MQPNKTTIIITTIILILTIIATIGALIATSGCLDFGGDDTVVTTNTDNIPNPEPIEPIPVETETQGENNITEPDVEPEAEQVETPPWYAHMENAEVGTYSTMFDNDIYGVKNTAWGVGNYDLFDVETETQILHHSEFTPSNLRLDLELSSDQYRELNARYGTLVSATMETIDNDPIHAGMDQVAIHYVGTGGEFTEEFNYDQRMKVKNYIDAHLRPELYPTLVK